MKVWKYKNKNNKFMLKLIGYTVVLILTIISVAIVTIEKEVKEEFKLISVRQKVIE